jgi:uncharacterized membrane protein
MKYQTTETGLELGKWLGGAAAGAAAGALLMYMFDPERGSARRAQSGEKIRDLGKQTGAALGGAWDKVGSRVSSAAEQAAESASRLAETARATSGIGSPDGAAGSVGESVSRMRHAASDAISGSMQQAAGRFQGAMQGMRGEWNPGTRNSAMVGGGLLGLYALMRRSPLAVLAGVAGLALLARGATNQPLRALMRGQGLGRTIDLEKSIRIDASPEEVYDIWSNYENFPKFMSHVMEVRDLGHRRSHWIVRGPAGTEFEWDSVLTEQSRPYRLAWRSEPGAEIAQTGSVQFEPWRGGTRVTVRMSYSPPAGAVGHGLAVLLGSDPRRQMDDDLARMKALIERGSIPHEAAQQGKSASRFLH